MLISTRYGVFADATDLYHATVYNNVDDAVAARDRLGGNACVYRMEPLSESGHWDWAVDHHLGYGPMEYVNERAARNSVGDHGTLLRRRSGTADWQAVAP
jgi:hypothetical protein